MAWYEKKLLRSCADAVKTIGVREKPLRKVAVTMDAYLAAERAKIDSRSAARAGKNEPHLKATCTQLLQSHTSALTTQSPNPIVQKRKSWIPPQRGLKTGRRNMPSSAFA